MYFFCQSTGYSPVDIARQKKCQNVVRRLVAFMRPSPPVVQQHAVGEDVRGAADVHQRLQWPNPGTYVTPGKDIGDPSKQSMVDYQEANVPPSDSLNTPRDIFIPTANSSHLDTSHIYPASGISPPWKRSVLPPTVHEVNENSTAGLQGMDLAPTPATLQGLSPPIVTSPLHSPTVSPRRLKPVVVSRRGSLASDCSVKNESRTSDGSRTLVEKEQCSSACTEELGLNLNQEESFTGHTSNATSPRTGRHRSGVTHSHPVIVTSPAETSNDVINATRTPWLSPTTRVRVNTYHSPRLPRKFVTDSQDPRHDLSTVNVPEFIKAQRIQEKQQIDHSRESMVRPAVNVHAFLGDTFGDTNHLLARRHARQRSHPGKEVDDVVVTEIEEELSLETPRNGSKVYSRETRSEQNQPNTTNLPVANPTTTSPSGTNNTATTQSTIPTTNNSPMSQGRPAISLPDLRDMTGCLVASQTPADTYTTGGKSNRKTLTDVDSGQNCQE